MEIKKEAIDESSGTYLLPVLLQGRHGGEVAGVVDELEFLEDPVVRQDIHAFCHALGKNKTSDPRENVLLFLLLFFFFLFNSFSVTPLRPLLSY